MNTYLTIWHYAFMLLSLLLFIAGIFAGMREEKSNLRYGIIFSSFLISILIGSMSVVVLDKYTKKAEVFSLKNRRILMNETIVYQGYIKNVGNYKIGTVKIEIKLVNKGHATGNVKGGNFYKPSGFFSFLSGGEAKAKARPQKVEHTFVIATNLEPGKSKHFSVTFPYPPYFSAVSDFVKLSTH